MPVFRMNGVLSAGALTGASAKGTRDAGPGRFGEIDLPAPGGETVARVEGAAHSRSVSGPTVGRHLLAGGAPLEQHAMARAAGQASSGMAISVAKTHVMTTTSPTDTKVSAPSLLSPAAPSASEYDSRESLAVGPMALKGPTQRATPGLFAESRVDPSQQARGALEVERAAAVRPKGGPAQGQTVAGVGLTGPTLVESSWQVREHAEPLDRRSDGHERPSPTANRELTGLVAPASAPATGLVPSNGGAAMAAAISGLGHAGRPGGHVTSPFLADLIDDTPVEEAQLASASHEPRLPTASFSGSMAPPARADVAPIIRQVTEGFARLADGSVDIRLSPEELGHVRLHMMQSESGLTVHITADRPETLDLMRRHIDQLARDLAEAGYEGAEFSFAEGSSDQDGRSAPRSGGPAADPAETPTAHDPAQAPVADGLDLRV